MDSNIITDQKGKIARINGNGFGFIRCDTNEEVYFHASQICDGVDIMQFRADDEVTFDIYPSPREASREARTVRAVRTEVKHRERQHRAEQEEKDRFGDQWDPGYDRRRRRRRNGSRSRNGRRRRRNGSRSKNGRDRRNGSRSNKNGRDRRNGSRSKNGRDRRRKSASCSRSPTANGRRRKRDQGSNHSRKRAERRRSPGESLSKGTKSRSRSNRY